MESFMRQVEPTIPKDRGCGAALSQRHGAFLEDQLRFIPCTHLPNEHQSASKIATPPDTHSLPNQQIGLRNGNESLSGTHKRIKLLRSLKIHTTGAHKEQILAHAAEKAFPQAYGEKKRETFIAN